jgi:lysophospholipase L1-like esterase
MILRDNLKFLFTGDSITAASRDNEAYQPYGKGFVHFAANSLLAKYPELAFQIINTGVSGNSSTQLLARWDSDCIAYKADVITILIGINDLWKRYKAPDVSINAVYPEQYESNCREMLDAIYESGKPNVIVLEPFMFCDNADNEMFGELKQYQRICRRLAAEYPIKFVGIQDEINSLLKYTNPAKWSNDMIHPLPWAHAWLSQKWLDTAMCLK